MFNIKDKDVKIHRNLLNNSPIFKNFDDILQYSASCPQYKTFSKVGWDCSTTQFFEVATYIIISRSLK